MQISSPAPPVSNWRDIVEFGYCHHLPHPPIPPFNPNEIDTSGGLSPPFNPQDDDLFKISATDAHRLLAAVIEHLVEVTGDVPPTPAPKSASSPQMSGMQAEKDNIKRSHSSKNLAQFMRQPESQPSGHALQLPTRLPATEALEPGKPLPAPAPVPSQETQVRLAPPIDKLHPPPASHSLSLASQIAPDGVPLRRHSVPELPSSGTSGKPYIIVGDDSQPLNLQHSAITRKFYSKNEPPITVSQYIARLHQFCPMSPAVYLATSLYIYRLAVEERAIMVTRRNAHRLTLAGLRVAMKTLEDLSHSHSKMAKIGGVSEAELARLEISFCFLTGFELVVGHKLLRAHLKALTDGRVPRMVMQIKSSQKMEATLPEVSPAAGA